MVGADHANLPGRGRRGAELNRCTVARSKTCQALLGQERTMNGRLEHVLLPMRGMDTS
jgi:hypothetical protein